MQSMQPIPIERALVPVLTAELTPKREPGLLARAFSERKRLYALFFAVFFVFASAGVLAFFQLNSASEQQALSAQLQASVRFAGDPTPANAFALSRRELMLAAVVFFCGFTVFSPVAALLYAGVRSLSLGYSLAICTLFVQKGELAVCIGGTALHCFFGLLFAVEVFRYVRVSVNGAAEMFKAQRVVPYLLNLLLYIISLISVDYFYLLMV